MLSAFRSSTKRRSRAGREAYATWASAALLALFAGSAWGQLPDGPGKAETEKICSQCHELARSISLRQDRAGWEATVNKMVGMGATASDAELKSITDYLTVHFAAEEVSCGKIVAGDHYEDEDGCCLVLRDEYYDCGCRRIRREYRDGSTRARVIRHDGVPCKPELGPDHGW